MRDYSLSVFIFVKYRDAMMYFTQDVYFYISRNTRRERLWMYQPRQVLSLEIWPYPVILRSERGSSCFRGLSECRGMSMVWMTNKAAFLARSNQHRLSIVMVII